MTRKKDVRETVKRRIGDAKSFSFHAKVSAKFKFLIQDLGEIT